MGTLDVIVINGKRYDAATGRLLAAASAPSPAVVQDLVKPKSGPRKVVDGFHYNPKSRLQLQPVKPKKTVQAAKRNHTAAKTVHSKPERSKTLMRDFVSKPASKKTESPSPKPALHHARPTPKTAEVPTKRIEHAAKVNKSPLISKYGAHVKPIERPIVKKVVKTPVAHPPVQARVSATLHSKPATNTRSIFEVALEQATSHTQKPHKKAKLNRRVAKTLRVSTKTLNIASLLITGILLTGFIAYQNMPNLALRVASTRAGVRAQLPAYMPAGFQLAGPIQYSPGQISVSYKSATDTRNFKLIQRNSAWNSETLLHTFITSGKKQYQTFQDRGRTIYIYDSNNATWVDGGIWYQVEGNSSLSSEQLLRIASSM